MLTFNEVFTDNALQVVHLERPTPDCQRLVTSSLTTNTGPYKRVLELPKTPVIHPYNPNGEEENQRHTCGYVRVLAALELNTAMYSSIAPTLGVGIVKTFMVFQTNPWKNIQLLFRPHPFLHSNEPEFNNGINTNSNVHVAFARGSQAFAASPAEPIVTHDGGPDAQNARIYSPNNFPAAPLLNQDGHCDASQTYTFSSVCIDMANPERASSVAAITLHVVLNDADAKIVQTICEKMYINQQSLLVNFLDQLFRSRTSIDLQQVQQFVCGLTTPPVGTPPAFDPEAIYAEFPQMLRSLANLNVNYPLPAPVAFAAPDVRATPDTLGEEEIAEIERQFALLEANKTSKKKFASS